MKRQRFKIKHTTPTKPKLPRTKTRIKLIPTNAPAKAIVDAFLKGK